MFYTWLQDEENELVLEVLLASSQKVTLNCGVLLVCRAEQKPVPSCGQSGRCWQEYPREQWALREVAGLARGKPGAEARPWADGKAAGGFGGFSKGSGLASGHTCLYRSFSAQRTGKASQEIGQDPRK